MRKSKDFKNQKDLIEEVFEELSSYDWSYYYKNRSTFIELFDDDENPNALNKHLNKLRSRINSALDFALIELREDKKAQENFMRWFCERFYLLMNKWVYEHLEKLDLGRRKAIIKGGKDLVALMKETRSKKPDFIKMQKEGKSELVFNFRKIAETLTNMKENGEKINNVTIISEEISTSVIESLGVEGLPSESPACFLAKLKNIKRIFCEKYPENEISVLNPVIGIFFSENQYLVVNFFWSIITRLDSKNTIRGFRPSRLIMEFINDKVYLRENSLVPIDEYDEESFYELKEEEKKHLTINQYLLIIKILGTYDIAKTELGLNGKKLGILLSSLFLSTPKSMENSLSKFESKISLVTPQMEEDIDVVRDLFCKIGLQDYYEKQLLTLGIVKME